MYLGASNPFPGWQPASFAPQQSPPEEWDLFGRFYYAQGRPVVSTLGCGDECMQPGLGTFGTFGDDCGGPFEADCGGLGAFGQDELNPPVSSQPAEVPWWAQILQSAENIGQEVIQAQNRNTYPVYGPSYPSSYPGSYPASYPPYSAPGSTTLFPSGMPSWLPWVLGAAAIFLLTSASRPARARR